MSTPQTVLNICSGIRIDNTYNDTLYFETQADQLNYFAGKVVKTFSAYSYIRKSWNVKVESNMETAKTWNYLYFRNIPTGKPYFYFITAIEYVNDNTVELTLELDVMQTYHFDYTLQTSFVERQHTLQDNYAQYTLDEGLDLGDYNTTSIHNVDMLKDLCIMVMSSIDIMETTEDTTMNIKGSNYGGVYSGMSITATRLEDWSKLADKLYNLSEWGKIDSVVNIWMYPKNLIALASGESWDDTTPCKDIIGVNSLIVSIPRPEPVKTSSIKNMKSYSYPNMMLYLTNNNGGAATYNYEQFDTEGTNKCSFIIEGSLYPEGGVRITPKNYKGVLYNYDESLVLNNYPTCSWNADMYKLWLAQNQNQQNHALTMSGLTIVGGVATAIGSAVTGNVVGIAGGLGAVVTGASQIQQALARKSDMSIQPPQSRGSVSGTLNVSCGIQTFTFYHKVAKNISKIDKYFKRYGYVLNDMTIVNRHYRPAYNYTKTINCQLYGNMCNEDLTKIKSIFDKGVTFWKNGDAVGWYEQDNEAG